MLISIAELAQFSGVFKEDDTTTTSLLNVYIGSAQQIIDDYVGFDVEKEYTDESGTTTIPAIFKLVCLEIASLIQLEESNNLGVNSSSDAGGIGRSFLNVVDYTKYLQRLSSFRKNTGM